MKNKYGTIIIYLVILAAIIAMVSGGFDFTKTSKPDAINYKDFLNLVEEDKVTSVQITDGTLYGLYKDSKYTEEQFFQKGKYDFYLTIPSETTFTTDMAKIYAQKNGKTVDAITSADYGFSYQYNPTPQASIWSIILPYMLMFGAVGLVFYFLMRSQTGGGKMANFGKSPARTHTDSKRKVTFDDVAGADEEKEELKEVVEFMRSPKRFAELGARIPKGVLLVGPPGTGKTLLAKATAGEANVPFFSISGSDFVEMFVGVGASRVRDLFNTAKKCAPALIFIDEIDAVGRHRGAGLGGGHDEREQTLNQLLVEMDGFAQNEGIIVIAATNRPDILDPALLRPGRFDRQITVNYPDVKGREEILKVHAKNKPFADDVNLAILAKRTPGFTGADLENVLNEGAILTARRKKKKIGMDELEEAIVRVIAGPEKRSRVLTPEDKRITAYHEAGHAIVALKLDEADKVHEVSIIPRGNAAGYTVTLPKDDRNHVSRSKLLNEIAMLLGGRVAESVALDDICTGAINDLQRASELARRMVVQFGMSKEIGPVYLGNDDAEVFIGRDWGHAKNYSEEVAAKIDNEIRRILDEQFERAKTAIEGSREALERVVAALMEHERMTGEEFEKLYNGEPVNFDSPAPPQPEKKDENNSDESGIVQSW